MISLLKYSRGKAGRERRHEQRNPMKNSSILITIRCTALFIPLLLTLSACVGCGDAEKGRSLIIIGIDAVQAAHTGFGSGYRAATTPNLDRLAGKSFVFTDAYSPSSWTLPVFMSWFTSLYPSGHGITNKYRLENGKTGSLSNLAAQNPKAITLAEILRNEGYRTAAFTGSAGLGGGFGFSRGFDTYFESEPFGTFDITAAAALEWLEVNGGEKFFLFLHGYDAHGKSKLPERFENPFLEAGYEGAFSGTVEEFLELRSMGFDTDSIPMSRADVGTWRAWYDEKVRAADGRLGRFFDWLHRLGMIEGTVIIVASDHGTELHEHNRFDHGFTLYQELIRVPMMIHIPGEKGAVVGSLVRTIDIMPTALDLLGIDYAAAAGPIDGVSLEPLIKGKELSLEAFSETDYLLSTFKRSIVTPDGWKMILSRDTNRIELYNLNADPDERVNLVEKERRIAYELEQKLYTYMGY